MFVTRLLKISNFKRGIFLPKTKILLTSRNLVFLNQAFLCSVSENPVTVAGFQSKHFIIQAYYRQYLLSNSEYRDLIFCENAKTNSKTADILNQLELNKEDNSNLKDQLYDYLNRELNKFTFNELCETTFLIMKFLKQNGADRSWEKILGSINEQCLTRISSWTVDELIKMTDISMVYEYSLRFKNKLLYKLMKKSSTSHEIVFLFYFLIRRKFEVPKEYLFDLQLRTLEILPQIDSTAAGIIAEGYFNSFGCLQKPDVLYYVLKKVIDDVETVDHVPFNSFCKFAKVMSNIQNWKGIPEFQKHAIETALRFGTENVIRLARCGENIRYLDSNLRSVLMKEVKDNIRQLSLFHIERVTHVNTLFNIHDEEFLKLAQDMFEMKEMTEKNRKTFILFLSHLIHYKIYPKNLLALVMEQEFVNNFRGNGRQIPNAWWFIYSSLEIEQPDCITVDLTPRVRNRIYQIHKFTMNLNTQKYQPNLWRIEKILTNRFGEGTAKLFMPLPHYLPGLLMRFDKNLKPQKIPEEFLTFNKSHTVKPLKDDHIWMFITFLSHIHLTNAPDFVPNLIFQTQVRQLNAIGYTVLPVSKEQFKSVRVKKEQLGEQLESLINAKLEECYKDQKGAVTN